MKNQSISEQILGLQLRANVLIGLFFVLLPVVLVLMFNCLHLIGNLVLFSVYAGTFVTLLTTYETKLSYLRELKSSVR